MEFLNETLYNKRTLDALTRISGYTVRSAKVWRSRFLSLLIALFGIGLGFFFPPENAILLSLARSCGIVFLLITVFWYPVQCFQNFPLAKNPEARRIRFREEGFGSDSQFVYNELQDIAVSADWIALFWDENHGVILDRAGFLEGNDEDFVNFLETKTDVHIIKI